MRTGPPSSPRTLDGQLGAKVFFKAENFQRMGAFKFRGAFNALSQFSPEQKKAGVLTFSSGNHAQAIALSAKLLGIAATIIMPQDAPASKLEATKGYGGKVVLYDRYSQGRDDIGRRLQQETGATLIPPFDHPDIIAGQGTAAKELFEEVGELDALFVCLGGGGLLAGSALSARALSPGCESTGVEPEAGERRQSFAREASCRSPRRGTSPTARRPGAGRIDLRHRQARQSTHTGRSDEECEGDGFYRSHEDRGRADRCLSGCRPSQIDATWPASA